MTTTSRIPPAEGRSSRGLPGAGAERRLAPPLICGQEHFDEIEGILRQVLSEAWSRL